MSEISSIYFGNKAVQSIETKNGVLYGGDKFIYEDYIDSTGTEGYKIVGSKYKRNDKITDIVIPKEYNHKPVLAIEASDLFNNYSRRVNLTLPSSIKKISGGAFNGILYFDTFYFDGSLEEWGRIDFDGLYDCPHYRCDGMSYFKNPLTNEWDQIDNSNGMARVEWRYDEVKKYTFYGNIFIKQKRNPVIDTWQEYKVGFELYLVNNQAIDIKEHAFDNGWCNKITPANPSTWRGYMSIGDYSFWNSKLLEFITPQNQYTGLSFLPRYAFSSSLIRIADFHTSNISSIENYSFEGCSELRAIKFSDSVQTTGSYLCRQSYLCREAYIYSFNSPGIIYNVSYKHTQEEPSIYFEYISSEGVTVHLRYEGENTVVLEYLDITPSNIKTLTLPSEFTWNGIACDKLKFEYSSLNSVSFPYTKINRVNVEKNFIEFIHTDNDSYTALLSNPPQDYSSPSYEIYFNGSMREFVSQYYSVRYISYPDYNYFYGDKIWVKENNEFVRLTEYISVEETDRFVSYCESSLAPSRTINKVRIPETFNKPLPLGTFTHSYINNLFCDTNDVSKLLIYFSASPNTWYGRVEDAAINRIEKLYIKDPNGTEVLEGETYSLTTEFIIPSSVTTLTGGTLVFPFNLTKLTIPVETTKFGGYSFYFLSRYNSSGLTRPYIYYEGTVEQWNAITKLERYKNGAPSNFTIHCTDGDTTL